MAKRLIYVILLAMLMSSLHAQDPKRYRDILFPLINVDSLVYSSPDGKALWMDIYTPVGDDTSVLRPLVIMAHGGSFMHGDRHSEEPPVICQELAKRGYVAVSIDYRLTHLIGMVTKAAAYRNIMKATADGRASVRWFLNDISQGNTYRIDKNQIFFGGNSAGAILAEQLAFIDSAAQCRTALRRAVRKYMPDAGALPPHTIRGVISLAGAVLDTNLIRKGHADILHIHGDADRVVPYGYKKAIYGWAPFRMAGLGGSRLRYRSQQIKLVEYVCQNEGHCPWNPWNQQFKIVMDQIVLFLSSEVILKTKS